MLKSFSNILQSSLTEFPFQFKIYMPQASAKFLLKPSSQSYPTNHTQNKLVSSVKHTPNIPIILRRVHNLCSPMLPKMEIFNKPPTNLKEETSCKNLIKPSRGLLNFGHSRGNLIVRRLIRWGGYSQNQVTKDIFGN